MSGWSNIEIVSPWYLLLLVALPAVWWWLKIQRIKYISQVKLSALSPGLPISLRARIASWLPWLKGLAFIVFVLALTRPRLVLTEEKVIAEGIDIFLVMDLSSSMLSKDFEPDRLEASKLIAADFIDKRPYDRIGLAVFAGESFTQCPLTTDHRVLKTFLAELTCGVLDDGTAIGMGLASATNRLQKSTAKSKIIILLTDGVNNAGYISPLTAAEMAKQFEIKVYTIGVGTQGEALAPVSRRSDGEYIFGYSAVEIDEQLLTEISNMTAGKYFRATSSEALRNIYDEIDKLEKTKIEVTSFKRYKEAFRVFAVAGLILLLLEWILSRTWLKILS